MNDGIDVLLVIAIKSNFFALLEDAFVDARAMGVRLHVLDIHRLIPKFQDSPNDWRDVTYKDHLTILDDWRELATFVGRNVNGNTRIVFLYPPERSLRGVWRVFRRRTRNVGVALVSPMPTSRFASGPERRPLLTRAALWLKSFAKPRPDFIIVSGSVCKPLYRTYFRTLKGVKEVVAHSIEYELARKAGTAGMSGSGKVVVLDQGWYSKPKPPFLRDDQYPPIARDRYRDLMAGVLRSTSAITKREIVVCCHPKADLEATRELYSGHDVVLGRTLDMVRDAYLVIGYITTSLVYAVIYRRPIVLFTSDELDRSVLAPSFEAVRDELDVNVIRLDDLETVKQALEDPGRFEKYDRFRDRYIKQAGSPDDSLWKIVMSGLGLPAS